VAAQDEDEAARERVGAEERADRMLRSTRMHLRNRP